MVESIYFLKPAWCGAHFAGLWPEQGFQPVTRATALRRWFVTFSPPADDRIAFDQEQLGRRELRIVNDSPTAGSWAVDCYSELDFGSGH